MGCPSSGAAKPTEAKASSAPYSTGTTSRDTHDSSGKRAAALRDACRNALVVGTRAETPTSGKRQISLDAHLLA